MTPPATRAAGFTMIELVMSMSLIVIVIVPLTSVIWSGLKTAAAGSHRTDAFAIAARETESMHADPYALVGFYDDQAASQWQNRTTVILGPCSTTCTPSFAPLILATGTSVDAGITYSIARFLYWADAEGLNNASTSTTFSQAYKGTTVTVTWTDPAGHHNVRQDSIVYPGGRGLYTGPGGSSPTTTATTLPPTAPGTPTLAVAAAQPAPPQDQQQVDLTITASASGGAVDAFYVQWSTDSTFGAPSQSPQLPPTSTSYSAQGLAAGSTYYLRMFASNATGQSAYSATVGASTAAMPVTTTTTAITIPFLPTTTTAPPSTTVPATTTTTTTCNLGGFTITTSTTGKTYLAKNGTMSENLVLNVSVNGACLWAATVTSVLHGTVTLDPSVPFILVGPPTGGQWSATVSASGQANWSVGLHDMTVLLAGTATPVTRGLLICAWKAPGQRSSLATTC